MDRYFCAEIDIEEELKKIHSQVIEEFKNSLFSLKNSVEVLESLRKCFCDIRKTIIRCKNLECLYKLYKQVQNSTEIIFTLMYTDSEYPDNLEEELLQMISKLIDEEREKTIEIANIVCKVNKMEYCFK